MSGSVEQQATAIEQQFDEVRQWWSQHYSEYGAASPELNVPRPIEFICDPTGQIIDVRFEPGARSHMDARRLAEALHQAAASPRYEVPAIPVGLDAESRHEAALDRADRMHAWAQRRLAQAAGPKAAPTSGVRSGGVTGSSPDGVVGVVYDGDRLDDVRVSDSHWASLAPEADIVAHVLQASADAISRIRKG